MRNISGAQNNAMNLTRSSRTACRPRRLLQCSAETAGSTATAKNEGLAPRLNSARSGSPSLPVAGRYGGRLLASAVIPGGGKAWPGSASLAQRHHLLQANVALSNSFSAPRSSTARAWLRLQQDRNATVPQNNALERTRRVGVPASQAVVGVPPCRSTQCCADADWREMSEGTMPLVGLPQSRSTRARGPVQRGSNRVAPRRQESAFSAQPAAPCSAGFSLR